MSQRSTPIAVTVLLGTLLGCASASAGTKIVSSWREPSAGPLQFKKVFVLCFAPYDSQRLFGEAELVRLMKRTQGVAAHSVMTADEVKDEQRMRAVMAREGFDGAVTLRFIGADQQLMSDGGYIPTSAGFWSYYSGGWPVSSGMGYVRTDRRVQMETQVHSIKDNKLIWSGLTESTNPDSAKKLVDEVARTVTKELRKQRLID